jgi:hypothetical protein
MITDSEVRLVAASVLFTASLGALVVFGLPTLYATERERIE